jgi:alkane 1-monooxygenase
MILSKRFVAPNGEVYIDYKRYLWLLSLFIPLVVLSGPIAFAITLESLWLLVPVLLVYLVIPVLDMVIGDDKSNPPESVVPQLEADRFYPTMTFLTIPVLVSSFVFCAWLVSEYRLSGWDYLAMVAVNGYILGYGINLGHEMGHKKSLAERWGAKLVLCLSGYGHFNVEHNRGHHVHVATPEDVASSKLGESIYRFYLREYPGAFIRAWRLESERLRRLGHSPWHYSNEVLQSLALTLVIYSALAIWLGWDIWAYLLLSALWGGFQLTSANYIEHYGLKRKKMPNGRYEKCQPHHSWNSNHLLSNWTLFHLQRHSDHHAYPMRRYQSLRNFDKIPQLPTGYYGMFLLAYVPPLWFRVMDKRVWQAVEKDWDRLNILPGCEEQYRARLVTK